MNPMATVPGSAPRSDRELDDLLSTPDDATITALAALDGDVMVLGAGGKMGPTLARMARRALDAAGIARAGASSRQVIAVSRFSNVPVADALQAAGVKVVRADLDNPQDVAALPDAANVIWMVGQKFGSAHDPIAAWTHNVVASVHASERFGGARTVCFSTGNVYARSPMDQGGAREHHPLVPNGEYAASCIGRERVFESVARRRQSPLLCFRLFYACDLRYGVVTDIARRILTNQPVDLSATAVNVIWQGDANRLALRALTVASVPSQALNVTGPVVTVRALATRLARLAGCELQVSGTEHVDALIANVDALTKAMPYDGMPLDWLLQWTVDWIRGGGRLLDKPTHFEVRDGRY